MIEIITGFFTYAGIMVGAYGFAWGLHLILPKTKKWGYGE